MLKTEINALTALVKEKYLSQMCLAVVQASLLLKFLLTKKGSTRVCIAKKFDS